MARMLELTDISVARGGVPVLQGVTCALGAGQALINAVSTTASKVSGFLWS